MSSKFQRILQVVIIRREIPEDIDSIRYVNEQAFEQKEETELIDKLRNRDVVTLSLVAVQDEQIVGHILFSPVTVESDCSSFEAISLAPMAVLPEYQCQGIGSQLVQVGLKECYQLGHEVVVVLGHPDYYPRFGFVLGRTKGIGCEFEVPDEAWMILELREGALAGRKGSVKFQPEFQEAT